MPKAPKLSRTRTASRMSSTSGQGKPSPKEEVGRVSKKDPRDSHLYTDDNPSTTLAGTGFKDAATAKHTLDIISERSITYQFQVVNTMYHRANNHPSMKKGDGSPNIKKAMEIFRQWLDDTYPTAKQNLRCNGFKPLLKKETVNAHLKDIQATDNESKTEGLSGMIFADMYVDLPQKKRLANVLVDEKNPAGRDWERERYEALNQLVPEGMESVKAWSHQELWDDAAKPTRQHLAMIAWAWSPTTEKKLK